MKTDKTLSLISLQLIICGLLNIQMDPRVKISLFITLILITMYLFFSRIQFIQHRKSIDTKLSRVLKGNLQARLFTSNDRSLHNIVFSINELIAELEKVRIEAKRSEESRKKLLSSISHDIRTPLTSIIGYIDALKDEVAASEIEKQEYLKILYMKSNNLKHLVDEIFNMAKLDANEFPLKEEELDFSEVTREVSLDTLRKANRKYIEFQVNNDSKATILLENQFQIFDYEVHDEGNIRIYSHFGQQGYINRTFVLNDIEVLKMMMSEDRLEDYFTKLVGGGTIG
ncbi:histidine kinase dimerization/phospho-acceptor domain-containing protein [Bacillus cereus group sp. MYBK222-1]|uniref:histidine kinase dimerization/phospho-acceptor domain-containing protein n=1 Tax=Bacillus cereus group TaxID=86661 RepID=UPI001E56D458|nr:histidine kinase dimerization/phospho-acceptor domain-containing protein [Bacillus paranthracis]MCC2375832.1 hypothetical protein [Bacillus paranthracis]